MVTDQRTKRLAGLKKETLKEILKLKTSQVNIFTEGALLLGIFCFPQRKQQKLASCNTTTRFFRLQPEYRGKRRIKVIVCNVWMQMSGDVLTAYLSIYGGVEQITQITSNSRMAYVDYAFIMCLDRRGFNNTPHIIKTRLINDGGR